MDTDYAIKKDQPPTVTTTSTPAQVTLYDRWERSNRLGVIFIKTKIFVGICGWVEQYTKVKELLKAIDEQFETSDKALASTRIMKFSSLRLTDIKGMCDHIIQMRDISAELRTLEVKMSETFLVHYILNTLPQA